VADRLHYLEHLVQEAHRPWPNNRRLTIACHGHSVPAGYFATPHVDTFAAYPHLWHVRLKERFPHAVFNVITTAIGGENAETGAARFATDVLSLRPDLITIDYGLNDVGLGLQRTRSAWESMIAAALRAGAKVILLTPTWNAGAAAAGAKRADALTEHARLTGELAASADVGLADPYAAFERHLSAGGHLTDLLCWLNHPSRRGHELVVDELTSWFPLLLPG